MNAAELVWAVIGTGTISRSVVPDLGHVPNARISVVHSRDPERAAAFAAEFHIPHSTSSFPEILADPTVDALYIATPFATHHELALAALNARKHVLVEKPMARTPAEVAELFASARANDVFVMEGMWMKFNPAYRRLHDEIQSGTIGEPRNMQAAFAFPFPEDGGSRWDVNRSGSTLLDQGIYPVTLAHSIFGLPSAVHATGIVRADGVDLSQHFTLQFEDGRFAQCISGMTEFSDPSASVSGERGWISIPAPFWSTTDIEIHAGASYESLFAPSRQSLPKEGNGYVPMLREVTEAILAGQREHPVHAEQDTVEVFIILDQIRRELDRTAVQDPSAP